MSWAEVNDMIDAFGKIGILVMLAWTFGKLRADINDLKADREFQNRRENVIDMKRKKGSK